MLSVAKIQYLHSRRAGSGEDTQAVHSKEEIIAIIALKTTEKTTDLDLGSF